MVVSIRMNRPHPVSYTHLDVYKRQADRSGWTVKVAPTTRGDAKNLIDGTNSDVARDGGAEYWLTVDIGKVQTLTGIRNKCYASSYSPTAVEVFRNKMEIYRNCNYFKKWHTIY